MATGPLIVQTPEETPTTSDECNGMDYQPQDTTLMADRRHSISFRQRHRSSSSDEEEVKPRKFSMDQHRSRSLQKEARIVNGKKEDSENIVCGASMAISNEFLAPSPVAKRAQASRPTSPSAIRPIANASRHRLASIRRESDCGSNNEMAHEKLVKTSQQASTAFEDFCLDDNVLEARKRAKSLAEPISVFTNAFLPQSSSPSPTRATVEAQKQCYSPSTNQIVRANISYSPSPSPTPASPTRSRIMRSMSPIAVRQISKRRYTATGSISGIDSDNESNATYPITAKRACLVRNAASPLVRDSLTITNIDSHSDYRSTSPLSVCSSSSFSQINRRFNDNNSNHQNSVDSDDNATIDEALNDQFYLSAPLDNCSTEFSSRTDTPVDEQMITEDSDSTQSQSLRSLRDNSLPPPSPLASNSISLPANFNC